MEVNGQLHASTPLPLGKEHHYPLNTWLGGPLSQSGCFGNEKSLFPSPKNRTRTHPAHSLVKILTTPARPLDNIKVNV